MGRRPNYGFEKRKKELKKKEKARKKLERRLGTPADELEGGEGVAVEGSDESAAPEETGAPEEPTPDTDA